MKRLESFQITLKTGPRGRQNLPQLCINDVDYELENVEGEASAGSVLKGSFNPHQAVHQFVLEGPDSGLWDIEETEITYRVREREPYTVRLGAVTLDPWSDMNLMYESPEDTFEV